jgi:hypothetical protein
MVIMGQLEEILKNIDKPKESDLVVKKVKNKYVFYFKTTPNRVGIGNTEIEALDNLMLLLNI